MNSSSDDVRRTGSDAPTRTFGPPATVVVGTLVAAFVFVVVLEFLVLISFVGQRLWAHPDMLRDIVFTLPLVLWVLIAAAATVISVRVLTAWLQIDEEGFELRGLGRPTVKAVWSEVGQVIAVRDIERGSSATEMLDAPASAYDGVYVLDRRGQRLLAVSSRFFGLRAQERTLEMARQAGVRIEHIDAIGTAELRAQVPQALSFGDRHPNLILLLLAAFYIFHNVLTFAVWGL